MPPEVARPPARRLPPRHATRTTPPDPGRADSQTRVAASHRRRKRWRTRRSRHVKNTVTTMDDRTRARHVRGEENSPPVPAAAAAGRGRHARCRQPRPLQRQLRRRLGYLRAAGHGRRRAGPSSSPRRRSPPPSRRAGAAVTAAISGSRGGCAGAWSADGARSRGFRDACFSSSVAMLDVLFFQLPTSKSIGRLKLTKSESQNYQELG